MTGKLVFENLKHRPMRSLLSVLLIGVPATLILTLVGLSHGMIADAQKRARGSGADINVRAGSSKNVLMQSAAAIPEEALTFFARQPHVTAVMGVVTHPIEVTMIVNGVDLDQLERMSGKLQYLSGGPFRGEYDVIIDRYYADQKKKSVGDTLDFMGQKWRVSGIVDGGKLAHILVRLKTLQTLDASSNRLSQIFLKLDNPANTDAVIQSLRKQLPDYTIISMEELTTMIQESVNSQGLSAFVDVIMGTAGTVLGILLSFGAKYVIETLEPASFQMDIAFLWWPRVLALTLAAATLGGLYPGLSAAQHDPIEALAYE